MDISTTQISGLVKVGLKGRLDERGAEEINSCLQGLDWGSLRELVFDFSEVTGIGSAGIGALLTAYRNMAAGKGELRVERLPRPLYELFQELKLDTLFTVRT